MYTYQNATSKNRRHLKLVLSYKKWKNKIHHSYDKYNGDYHLRTLSETRAHIFLGIWSISRQLYFQNMRPYKLYRNTLLHPMTMVVSPFLFPLFFSFCPLRLFFTCLAFNRLLIFLPNCLFLTRGRFFYSGTFCFSLSSLWKRPNNFMRKDRWRGWEWRSWLKIALIWSWRFAQ